MNIRKIMGPSIEIVPLRSSITAMLASLLVLACGKADESSSYSTVILNADGAGNTYELINSVLGGNAIEVPDCGHEEFGPHITEKFDEKLGKYVFVFHIHTDEDDDRCTNFDRQRNEIKTYGPSPDHLKAFYGDEMIFTWKFKLDEAFQPSSNFTHIHQLKAGDGSNAGMPIITVTPRYGNPDQLEIIHSGDSRSSSLGKVELVDLESFTGVWVEAVSKVRFGSNGAYELEMKSVSDGRILLRYANDDIDLWRRDATFVRPKWGIYRSLNSSERLRDEVVLFADFLIGKK